MEEGKRLIRNIQLESFLSHGSEGENIELLPLNVLIGPNASGKSNLIEAMGILKATPTDLPDPIRQGGGITDFLWKGKEHFPIAKLTAIVDYSDRQKTLRYQISFTAVGQKLEIVDEFVENEQPYPNQEDVYFYYRYQNGYPVINVFQFNDNKQQSFKRSLRREDLIPDQSVLSQRKDPDLYPEISYLSDQFSRISLYRKWDIGRESACRNPQKTDLPDHPLLEDGSNLGLFLSNLQYQIGSRRIIEKLKKFYEIEEELSITCFYCDRLFTTLDEKINISPLYIN